MILSRERLLQTADAMTALADGQTIQCRAVGGISWVDFQPGVSPDWSIRITEYRRKPEPKTRPWSNPEDVPGPACWLRWIDSDEFLILRVCLDCVWIHATGNGLLTWQKIKGAEYSTDRKTWHPCTVEVTE